MQYRTSLVLTKVLGPFAFLAQSRHSMSRLARDPSQSRGCHRPEEGKKEVVLRR